MILGSASTDDVIEHIKGIYEKLQSFQINNFDELKNLFRVTLKRLGKFISEDFDNGKLYAPHMRRLALAHFKSVNYKEAEHYTELLLKTFPNHKHIITDEYTNRTILDSVKEAYEYNNNGNKYLKELKNSSAFISYNNLGHIFLCKNNYSEALDFFEKAHNAIDKKNLNYIESSVLQNISIIHFYFKNYDEALKHLAESSKLKRTVNDLKGAAFGLHLTGKILLANNNFGEAACCFQRAIKILERTDDNRALITCYLLLVKTNIKSNLQTGKVCEKNYKESNGYLSKALRIAKSFNSKRDMIQIYKNFEELNISTGNFTKAEEYSEKSKKIEKLILQKKFFIAINRYKRQTEAKKTKFLLDSNQLFNSEFSEIEKALRENDKQKNEFYRNVVHDLKNPIGNIKQLVEYLTPGTELSSEDKNDFMQLILESADASLGLVTKLLDSSAIEHSGGTGINLESFDISEEITKLIKIYTRQTANKSLTLIFENSREVDTVKTDKEILMRILDNLISNAIKFSPIGKNIWVKLSDDNMFLKIEIKDEGPGFSVEDREKLFTQFSRLSARPTAGEHSTGLGLSIVKKLVDSLNGTIECISEKGKGANMIVRIPIGR